MSNLFTNLSTTIFKFAISEKGVSKLLEWSLGVFGVTFYSNNEVISFLFKNGSISKVETTKKLFDVDVVLSGADYYHTEQKLLPKKYRNYSSKYWEKKTMSPSSLLFYIGTNKKLKNIENHCLFFDKDFNQHAKDIYEYPQWPEEPLFYASFSFIAFFPSLPRQRHPPGASLKNKFI